MQTQETPVRQSSFLIGLTREQLEGLPWAITKVNREGVFTYGNRAMSEIIGGESVEGKTLTDVFRGDHLAVVREHLDSRFSRGVADEYEVEAVRPTDGVCIPIRCSAMPDINDQGEIVGTIAIVRDLLVDDVSSAVHKAVEDLRDGRAILQAVARQCERIVPFDIFGVNLFSADGEHSRTFYLYPESPFQLGVRWRQMSDYAKKLVETNQIINVPDEMGPRFASERPTSRSWAHGSHGDARGWFCWWMGLWLARLSRTRAEHEFYPAGSRTHHPS